VDVLRCAGIIASLILCSPNSTVTVRSYSGVYAVTFIDSNAHASDARVIGADEYALLVKSRVCTKTSALNVYDVVKRDHTRAEPIEVQIICEH
jgi:hypothetical protein